MVFLPFTHVLKKIVFISIKITLRLGRSCGILGFPSISVLGDPGKNRPRLGWLQDVSVTCGQALRP